MLHVFEQLQAGDSRQLPFGRGLVNHFVARPGYMGGNGLVGLINRRRAKFVVNTTAPAWASSVGRPGGYGSIKTSISGSNGGYLACDHTGISGFPFTLSAWLYATTTSTIHRAILGIYSDTAKVGVYAFGIRLFNSSQTRYSLWANNNDLGGGIDLYDSTVTQNISGWQHVVAVFSSATSRTLYANGVSIFNRTTSVTFNSATATGSTWIGARNLRGSYASDTVFSGYIDDARVWNRELSATEIQALYLQSRLPQTQLSIRRPVIFLFGDISSVYTGSSGLSTQPTTVSASATFTKPTFTGTSSLSVQPSSISVAALFTKPVFTASAFLTSHSASLAAASTFSTVVFTGSSSVSTHSATSTSSATFKPVYTASSALTVHSATLSSSAIFASVVFTASANVQTHSTTVDSTAAFSAGTKTATAILVTTRSRTAIVATYTRPSSSVTPPHLEGETYLYLIQDLSGILPFTENLVGILRFPGE